VISVITIVEVLVGVKSVEEEKPVRQFLARFEVRAVDAVVAERAVVLRRELRLKVPDAIIYATAGVENCPLVARNVRDFGADRGGRAGAVSALRIDWSFSCSIDHCEARRARLERADATRPVSKSRGDSAEWESVCPRLARLRARQGLTSPSAS